VGPAASTFLSKICSQTRWHACCAGKIPPQISQLSALKSLILASNHLTGACLSLPISCVRSEHLFHICAHTIICVGGFPIGLIQLPALRTLYLNDNPLAGPCNGSCGCKLHRNECASVWLQREYSDRDWTTSCDCCPLDGAYPAYWCAHARCTVV